MAKRRKNKGKRKGKGSKRKTSQFARHTPSWAKPVPPTQSIKAQELSDQASEAPDCWLGFTQGFSFERLLAGEVDVPVCMAFQVSHGHPETPPQAEGFPDGSWAISTPESETEGTWHGPFETLNDAYAFAHEQWEVTSWRPAQ